MKFSSVVRKVSDKAARPLLMARKNSPTGLLIVGAVGFVATVVLAARATLKADEVVQKAQNEFDKVKQDVELIEGYSDTDRIQAVTRVYTIAVIDFAKLYGPTVLVGAASLGALVGSHVVLNRRNAALTAAYVAVSQGFEAYRQRVVDKYGAKADTDLRFDMQDVDIVEEGPTGPEVKTIQRSAIDGPSIYAVWFDEENPNWKRDPNMNQYFVNCQQNHANDRLRGQGYLTLNSVYKMLGMPDTSAGQMVGWVYRSERGDGYVDFGFAGTQAGEDFMNGDARSVRIDPNVDGIIYHEIDRLNEERKR